MPTRVRTFSETLYSDDDSGLTAQVFPNSRGTNDRAMGPVRVHGGPLKRRKTSGLNSRYDRMIDTVKIMHTPASSAQLQTLRQRAASSGSSSVTSHDMPRTPVDAYSHVDCSLGQDFSTIKMQNLSTKRNNSRPLPSWLSSTLMTLDSRHPLRVLVPSPTPGLVPSSDCSREIRPPTPQEIQPLRANNEDRVFAFCSPTEEENSLPVLMPSTRPDLIPAANVLLPAPQIRYRKNSHSFDNDRHSNDIAQLTDRGSNPCEEFLAESTTLPFSTPGPASHLAPLVNNAGSPLHDSLLDLTYPHDSIFEDMRVSPVMGTQPTPFSKPGPLACQTESTPLPSALYQRTNAQTVELSYPAPDKQHMSLTSPSDSSFLSELLPSDDVTSLAIPTSGYLVDLQTLLAPAEKPFSTPGPLHFLPPCAPLRVYFDSPTEDPAMSDPLEPPAYELALDYDVLGFKWAPFERGGAGPINHIVPDRAPSQERIYSPIRTPESQSSGILGLPKYYAGVDEGEKALEEAYPLITPLASQLQSPGHRSSSTDILGLPEYQSGDDVDDVDYDNWTVHTRKSGTARDGQDEEMAEVDVSFAPVQGIFVSPLRTPVPSQTGSENKLMPHTSQDSMAEVQKVEVDKRASATPDHQEATEAEDLLPSTISSNHREHVQTVKEEDDVVEDSGLMECTQTSHDSIESWADTAK